jgi:hypothetical protein
VIQFIKDILKKRKDEKAKARLNEIFNKNREHFEAIHSDKRDPGLKDIYHRLHSGDKTLTDDEILFSYNQFSNSIQTNTFCAAELELVSISTICYFRPHLTEQLLRQGLKMILWSLGDGIDYSILKQFIDKRIVAPELEPYGGIPDKEGMEWLTKIVVDQNDLIKRTLADVIDQNNKELDELNNSR